LAVREQPAGAARRSAQDSPAPHNSSHRRNRRSAEERHSAHKACSPGAVHSRLARRQRMRRPPEAFLPSQARALRPRCVCTTARTNTTSGSSWPQPLQPRLGRHRDQVGKHLAAAAAEPVVEEAWVPAAAAVRQRRSGARADGAGSRRWAQEGTDLVLTEFVHHCIVQRRSYLPDRVIVRGWMHAIGQQNDIDRRMRIDP
jgi:hypothetical protein